MIPFKTDPETKIRRLQSQIGRFEDRENEVVDRIRRYLERFREKYDEKTSPITQIIEFCDRLWTSQDTYWKLAENNRQELLRAHEQIQKMGEAIDIRDSQIIDGKVALRNKEQEAKVQLREHEIRLRKHEEETSNFLHTIGQLNGQINEIKAKHEANVRGIHDAHRNALDSIKLQHQYASEKLQTDCAWREQNQRDHYERELATQREAYEQELQRKEAECAHRIASMEADLLDNSDDFRPATDDVLKVKYRKLKVLIDTITDPFNLGVSGVTHLSNRLDPTDFLSREGNKFLRFLLRGVVWGIVMDGFFSLPFGFGALGPDAGRQQLLELYRAWLRIYSTSNESRKFNHFSLHLDLNG